MSRKKKIDQFLDMLIWVSALACVGLGIASVPAVASKQSFVYESPDYLELSSAAAESSLARRHLYKLKDNRWQPRVTANSYLLADLDTGEIILEKRSKVVVPIASISKLLTALTAEEELNLSQLAAVSPAAVAAYGTAGHLRTGEKIAIKDLFYPLLLESSNDAAEVLAESGNRTTFINKMNEKAKALGLFHTSFEDPSGLSENNVSTAADLFRLIKFFYSEKKELLDLTCRQNYFSGRHLWRNANQLSRLPGYLGGKNGFTDEARKTAIALYAVPIEGSLTKKNIAVIVLQSESLTSDVKTMIEYLKKNIHHGQTTI